jgi:hypothetical protein
LLVCGLLIGTRAAPAQPQKQSRPKEIWIGDIFTDDDSLSYGGYVLQKLHRKVSYDYPRKTQTPSTRIDVSYAVLKRRGKSLAKFDDHIYFGMGNDTRFGLISILGDSAKQAVISQDVPRGGTQWVVTLSPHPRVIFDGPRWSVGREGDDMGITDFDADGIYEITVPITDFYALQDKMSISQIPLPEIVFRYARGKRKYLPANPRFQNYLLGELSPTDDRLSSNDPLELRSAVLKKLLTYIYVGRERSAWDFYDRAYKLDDRLEIKRRVKSILHREPVYKFIYNRAGSRR